MSGGLSPITGLDRRDVGPRARYASIVYFSPIETRIWFTAALLPMCRSPLGNRVRCLQVSLDACWRICSLRLATAFLPFKSAREYHQNL